MEENQLYTIILRHDESTSWMINNPVLALGEYGVEDDTHRIKRGDGQSKWSELPYDHMGFEYAITFENLSGDIEDNEALKKAIDGKVSTDIFSDTANSVVGAIVFKNAEGKIGRLTRVTKEVTAGLTSTSYVDITSNDNSITGVWTTDSDGVKVLDLTANTSIEEYEPGRKYYRNQLCFYNGKLCRAKETVKAETEMDITKWVILASTVAEDISYDPVGSSLTSTNVKEALAELSNKTDNKVEKTTIKNKIYGTDSFGNQTLIDIDDVGKVDTVNHIAPDKDRNVELTGKDIKYTDTETSLTIKQAIDVKANKSDVTKMIEETESEFDKKKVDKDIGDTIVTNIKLSTSAKVPTLSITKADTDSKEVTNVDLHLQTTGTLKTSVENDTIIIDDSELEEHITELTTKVNETSDKVTTEISKVKKDIIDTNSKIDTVEQSLTHEIGNVEATLTDKIETVEEEITDINKDITTLKTDVETNANEISAIKIVNTNQDTRLDTLEGKVETVEGNISTINEKDKQQDKDIAANKKSVSDVDTKFTKEIEDLKSDGIATDKDIEDIKDSIGTLSTSISTINSNINNIKEKDTAQDTSITSINNKLTSLENMDTSLRNQIDTITGKDEEQDNKLDEINTFIETINTKNEAQDTRMTIIEDSLKTTNDTVKSNKEATDLVLKGLQEKDESLDSDIETINTSIESINDNIENINTKNGEQDGAINTLDQKITTVENDLTNRIEAIEDKDIEQDNRLNGIDTSIEDIESDITTINTYQNTQDTNILANKTAIESLQEKEAEDVLALQTKDTALENKNKEQDESIATINTSISNINNDIDDIQTTQETLNTNINTALGNITALDEKVHEELEDIRDIADDQATMIDAMNNSIETINGSITNIRNKNSEQDRAIDSLRTTVNTHISTATEAIERIDNKDVEQDGRLSNLDTEISNLNSAMADTNSIVASINAKNVELSDKYVELTQEYATETAKNIEQDGRLNGIDTDIANIKAAIDSTGEDNTEKFNAIDEEIDSLKDKDTKLASDISDNADAIAALQTRATTNEGLISTNATNIQTNADDIKDLQDDKLDKVFAESVDNKLVDDVRLSTTSGTDIIILEQEKLDVINQTKSASQLKITSKDNTIVAKTEKDEQGNIINIDLATNLDIDVNYFISQVLLNTTIASSNVIDISKITPITKEGIEVEDIISDEEGTWARVQSIDEDANTVTAITYAKHAKATWGAIKGNIVDQGDLQDEFNKFGVTLKSNGSGFTLLDRNGANLGDTITITDTDNAITTTGSGTTLTTKVNAENIDFDTKSSELTSNKVSSAIRELKALDDLKLETATFNTYKTTTSQELEDTINTINTKIETADTSLDEKIDSSVEALTDTISDVNNAKVDKDQGASNKGKHLMVGDDGKVTLEKLDLSGYVQTVTSDFGLVDNTDTQNPKILHDDAKLNKDFSDKYLRTFGIQANTDQGVLEASTRNVEDGQDVVNTVDIIGLGGIAISSAYDEDRENDTIKIDATTLETNITNLGTTKLDKQTDANTIYGVDTDGKQTMIDINTFGAVNTVNNKSVDENTKNVTIYGSDIEVSTTNSQNIPTALDTKVDKVTGKEVVYGTDDKGNQTSYPIVKDYLTAPKLEAESSFDKLEIGLTSVDEQAVESKFNKTIISDRKDISFIQNETKNDIINVQVEAENITFNPDTSKLTSLKVADAIRELKGLDDLKVKTSDFETYKTETSTSIAADKKELEDKIDSAVDSLTDTISDVNTTLDTAKVDKVKTANQVYGTDENGNQTSFNKSIFGDVDTVNGVAVDTGTKNITITSKDIIYDGTTTIFDEVADVRSDYDTDLKATKKDLNDRIDIEVETLNTTITNTKTTLETTISTEDAKKVDKSNSASVIYGTDAEGKQTTYNKSIFGSIDSVNNVTAGEDKNINIDTNDIKIDKSKSDSNTIYDTINKDLVSDIKFTTANGLNYLTYTAKNIITDTETTQQLNQIISESEPLKIEVSGRDLKFTVIPKKLGYDNSTSKLASTTMQTAIDELKATTDSLAEATEEELSTRPNILEYEQATTYKAGQIVHTIREDNITLMAIVLKDYKSDNTESTKLTSFIKDFNDKNISLIGIPLDWNEGSVTQQEENNEEETQTSPGE